MSIMPRKSSAGLWVEPTVPKSFWDLPELTERTAFGARWCKEEDRKLRQARLNEVDKKTEMVNSYLQSQDAQMQREHESALAEINAEVQKYMADKKLEAMKYQADKKWEAIKFETDRNYDIEVMKLDKVPSTQYPRSARDDSANRTA